MAMVDWLSDGRRRDTNKRLVIKDPIIRRTLATLEAGYLPEGAFEKGTVIKRLPEGGMEILPKFKRK